MTFKYPQTLPAVRVPQTQHPVLAPREDLPTVRTEAHRVDPVSVAAKRGQASTRFHLPQAELAVRRSRELQPAVRAERHRYHSSPMTFTGAEGSPLRHVPYPYVLVTAAGGHVSSRNL